MDITWTSSAQNASMFHEKVTTTTKYSGVSHKYLGEYLGKCLGEYLASIYVNINIII